MGTDICEGTSGSGFTISQNIKKNGSMIKSSIKIYRNMKLRSLIPKSYKKVR